MCILGDVRRYCPGSFCRCFVKAPDRLHIDSLRLSAEHSRQKEDKDAGYQKAAQNRLHDSGFSHANHVQPSKKDQHCHGEKHLSHIDIKAGNIVVKAEF